MVVEIARLLLGLLFAGFHREIADFVGERERSLELALRQRGLPLPPALGQETTRNLYFCIGIFIVLVEMVRLYQMSH